MGLEERDDGKGRGSRSISPWSTCLPQSTRSSDYNGLMCCYTAKADLAECRVPSAETSENCDLSFQKQKGQKVRGDQQEKKLLSGCVKR